MGNYEYKVLQGLSRVPSEWHNEVFASLLNTMHSLLESKPLRSMDLVFLVTRCLLCLRIGPCLYQMCRKYWCRTPGAFTNTRPPPICIQDPGIRCMASRVPENYFSFPSSIPNYPRFKQRCSSPPWIGSSLRDKGSNPPWGRPAYLTSHSRIWRRK